MNTALQQNDQISFSMRFYSFSVTHQVTFLNFLVQVIFFHEMIYYALLQFIHKHFPQQNISFLWIISESLQSLHFPSVLFSQSISHLFNLFSFLISQTFTSSLAFFLIILVSNLRARDTTHELVTEASAFEATHS